jgi:hypothetical protein
MLQWIHRQLMDSAVRVSNSPNPEFPYRATKHVQNVFPPREGLKYNNIGTQITRLLYVNGLAWKKGGGGKPYLYLRHWPHGFVPGVLHAPTSQKMDYQTERAIEREAKTERPVVVTHDLRLLTLPEMTPDAITDWVKRFVPAALKVQDENKALRERVAELEAELEERQNGSAWAKASDAITEAFKEAH